MDYNSRLPVYMKKFTDRQRLAIELMASQPGISTKDASTALDCTGQTIRVYRRDPAFNEAVYSRFMDISGGRLVGVVDAMIREAIRGNVQAATLILKHYGKLEDKLTVRIESPFERFLKIGNFEEAEVIESDVAVDVGSSLEITTDLPERDESNNKPLGRKRDENKKIATIRNGTFRNKESKELRKKARNLRERAIKVGMSKLPPGRQRKNVRLDWIEELESREKAMGIQ
tara:strand:- start:1679 stop:2368 length:690 start_codon:yes stop_codon:yes gene_type:complete